MQPVVTLAADGQSGKGRWHIMAMLGGYERRPPGPVASTRTSTCARTASGRSRRSATSRSTRADMRIPAGPPTRQPTPFHFDASRVGKPILDRARASARQTDRTPTLADAGEAHGGSRRARPASQRRDRDHESPARVRLLRRSEDVGRRRGSVRHRRHDGDRSAGRLRRTHEHPPRAERVGRGTRRGRDQRSHPPADHRDRDARRPHRSRARHRHRHDRHDRRSARCGASRSTRTSS